MSRRALAGVLGFVLMAACSGSGGDDIGPAQDDAGDAVVEGDASVASDSGLPSDGSSGDARLDAASDGGTSDADALVDAASIDAPTTCQAELVALGLSFKPTAARGVVDAVKLTGGDINGVLFASGTDTTPMGDPLACEFAKTLYQFADLLKSKGFVRVGTLGSYCYRCCCAWSTTNFCRGLTDPEPDCGTSGYSNHSWGRAIDVRYLYKSDGTRYDINDPTMFVKYATTDTCGRGILAQTPGSISLQLYTLACDATKNEIFGTVLTPNYNADHRNHFHMDIGKSGTPTSWSTLDWSSHPVSAGVDDAPYVGEGCGDE